MVHVHLFTIILYRRHLAAARRLVHQRRRRPFALFVFTWKGQLHPLFIRRVSLALLLIFL